MNKHIVGLMAGKNKLLWAHTNHPKPSTYDPLGVYTRRKKKLLSLILFFFSGELLIEAVRSGQEVRVRDALIKGLLFKKFFFPFPLFRSSFTF